MSNIFNRFLLLFAVTCGLFSSTLAQKTTGTFYYLESAIDSADRVITLDLSGQTINTLPAEITRMKHLKSLRLRGCKLKKLPKIIGKLTLLEELDLDFNELTSLPPALAQLTQLKRLSLYKNHLKKVPMVVASLKNLEHLNLAKNQLKKMPEAMAKLTKLRTLYLYRNALEVFPSMLKNIATLQTLELANNKLSKLPADIQWFARIKDLQLMHNPWSKQARRRLGWDKQGHLNVYFEPVPLEPMPHRILFGADAGKNMALSDVRKGKYKLIFYGMPDGSGRLGAYMNALKKMGIDSEHVGCVVDGWMEGYNEVMGKKIAAKLGKDYWVKPRLISDSVTNSHLPRLDGEYNWGQRIDLSNYINHKLPKKTVHKRHHQRKLKLQITIDSSLKKVEVKVLQGVSRRIDRACVEVLKTAAWTAPRSWFYLRRRGKVVFETEVTLWRKK